MSSVQITNIDPEKNEADLRKFLEFCGNIKECHLQQDGDAKKAKVTFEAHSAADTALLLTDTMLGGKAIEVSRLEDEASSSEEVPPEIPQHEKPRTRILAEYLAQGYTLSDRAIESAIMFDKKYGFSSKFIEALGKFDRQMNAKAKAQNIDDTYGLSRQATSGFNKLNSYAAGLNSYFEKAVDTPTGRKLRDFYVNTEKQVKDIHNEARRLREEHAKTKEEQPHEEQHAEKEKTHAA